MARAGPHRSITYPQPFADFAVAAAQNSTRELRILSPTLDATVFDRNELENAVKKFLIHSEKATVRILISDATPVARFGHRLLSLARRLPSRVAIRVLEEHPELPSETLVLGDRRTVLRRSAEQDDAIYRRNAPALARDLLNLFDRLWELGKEDPQLRILHI